ncbi:N-acetyl-1-D-myo-inositol-2-amino-2-deoxy-alpha-D-glucopyranoside deacetylase [Herbidospora galbida]|uniref:1D-myo-inositol 2-acetamido-2-deoxy-alpha-D-glucopyranoside deacetylase n=1 Tax=Herbidospora galbida TaxID=2575442 RepID=A0A4U3M8Z2_9ACTN|nr:N-acetyl-1-D-myo-inositol-2-amino-2-deoxy-alpha-D-glucopyranoside deacetylase [Herbidospora galbida]
MLDRRLLLVHAHPDDETIGTGATMARYAAEGAHVTLVTCTRGEEGEIIPSTLSHLGPDDLGAYRERELAAACRALGVDDHRFLGYRDSGMMGAASNDDPRCFWRAPVDEAAERLLQIIDEVRPQVIVTYDENGLYGHPDHIQAHRVAWRAFEQAGTVAKFYQTAQLRSEMLEAAARMEIFRPEDVDALGYGRETVTTSIDARAYLDAKLNALRAHGTQITVDAPRFALSNGVGQEARGVEHFVRKAGPSVTGCEDDLFAGIG